MMGYIKHHAIMIVGVGYPEAQKMLRDTHAKAIEPFLRQNSPASKAAR